jgi:CelD/BcsL family acetyltransferase involved in cellulose biosynthesis
MLRVNGVSAEDVFAGMRDEWNGLLERSASGSVFQTWEWAFAWWSRFKGGERRLFILSVKDGEDVVGIAPWVVTRHRLRGGMKLDRVEFLGEETVHGDHLDMLVDARADRQAVVGAAVDFMEGARGEWDLIHLNGVPDDSRVGRILEESARAKGYRVVREPYCRCPLLRLPGSWEELEAGLKKGLRRNFTYQQRRLEREFGLRFERLDRSDLEKALGSFFDLHEKRWREKGKSGSFTSKRKRDFYREAGRLLSRGDGLRINGLFVGDALAGVLFGLRYGRSFSYLQSGLDPAWGKYSVGQLLVGNSIRQAIEEGCETFDFLRGPEEYKYDWGAADRRTVRLTMSRPTAKMGLFHAVGAAAKAAERLRG